MLNSAILLLKTFCVSFQAVPAEFQNGENFHYVVHFHIYHVSSSRTIRESDPIIVGNKTLYSFPHLDSHSAYIFRIYAVNSMGRSMNSSHVIIDKSDKCKFCIYSFLEILLVCYYKYIGISKKCYLNMHIYLALYNIFNFFIF